MSEPLVYNEELDEDDHVFTVEEFKDDCKNGMLIDYDGFGCPVKDGKAANLYIYPSEREKIPAEATHIVWYNR